MAGGLAKNVGLRGQHGGLLAKVDPQLDAELDELDQIWAAEVTYSGKASQKFVGDAIKDRAVGGLLKPAAFLGGMALKIRSANKVKKAAAEKVVAEAERLAAETLQKEQAAAKATKAAEAAPKLAKTNSHEIDALSKPDPNWVHSWKEGRSGTSHNADTLGTNMGLGPASETGLDAHHIVQSTNNKVPEFQKARDLLLEHQIDINSSKNGVALRTTKPDTPLPADPNLRIHKGGELHTNEGGRRTNKRLQDAVDGAGTDWAVRRQALLSELDKMRSEIAAGTFP